MSDNMKEKLGALKNQRAKFFDFIHDRTYEAELRAKRDNEEFDDLIKQIKSGNLSSEEKTEAIKRCEEIIENTKKAEDEIINDENLDEDIRKKVSEERDSLIASLEKKLRDAQGLKDYPSSLGNRGTIKPIMIFASTLGETQNTQDAADNSTDQTKQANEDSMWVKYTGDKGNEDSMWVEYIGDEDIGLEKGKKYEVLVKSLFVGDFISRVEINGKTYFDKRFKFYDKNKKEIENYHSEIKTNREYEDLDYLKDDLKPIKPIDSEGIDITYDITHTQDDIDSSHDIDDDYTVFDDWASYVNDYADKHIADEYKEDFYTDIIRGNYPKGLVAKETFDAKRKEQLYNKEIEEKEKEIKKLKFENQQLQDEKAREQAKSKKDQEEKQRLKKEIKEDEREIKSLNDSLETKKHENEELTSELKSQNFEHAQQLETLEKEKKGLEDQLKASREETRSANSKIYKLTQAYKKRGEELTANANIIKILNENNESKDKELEEKDEVIAEQNKKIESLSKKLDECTSQVNGLAQQLDGAREQHSDKESDDEKKEAKNKAKDEGEKNDDKHKEEKTSNNPSTPDPDLSKNVVLPKSEVPEIEEPEIEMPAIIGVSNTPDPSLQGPVFQDKNGEVTVDFRPLNESTPNEKEIEQIQDERQALEKERQRIMKTHFPEEHKQRLLQELEEHKGRSR